MAKIPIVFAFDEKYCLPASIAIKSLLDSKSKNTEYDIFVLHNGIKKREQQKFDCVANINWIFVDKSIFNNFPTSEFWTELVYYRLLIPQLIPQYDKVIYSDIDVLFKKDLSEVYKKNIDDYYWGGVIAEKNNANSVCHKYFPENQNEYIYMSGFMLINSKKMLENEIINKLFYNAYCFKDKLRFFDLDLLNITCNKILAIPFEYCVLENIYDNENITTAKEYVWLMSSYSKNDLIRAKENVAIIHYAGKDIKIWNRNFKEIPKYYWKYIVQSPFYDKEFYFPSKIKSYTKKTFYWLLEHICPIKKWRKAIRQIRKEIK